MKIKGEMLDRHLVCMDVDTDKIDAEGNETIWLNNRVSMIRLTSITVAAKDRVKGSE